MIRREDALSYHSQDRPGKLEVKPTKSCLDPREIRLAYVPGAVFPGAEIARDPASAYRFTGRGNLVASVTNGTAVAGLGNVGPLAAKPMQEGIAVLFKRLADIDVFDLEIDAQDPKRFADVVRALEPTFGGINLKDIRAPDGLAIYDELRETLGIPVFHESLYSTAVVATAALINALDLANKRLEEVRVVICGAGTVGLGCARVLASLGIPKCQLILYDVNGLIHPDREDLHAYQRAFAQAGPELSLVEGVKGADAFIGASTGGVLTPEMIRSMGVFPVILALATPDPEITYDQARAVRRDVIVATSLTGRPNTIVDLLAIPYIFRGALDVQATRITPGMNLAAARALASLTREDVPEEVSRAYGNEVFTFGPEYLLPKPIDPRILVRVSSAVAEQAVQEGVAQLRIDPEQYQEALTVRVGTGREMKRQLILKARQLNPRVVFPEGDHETILRACRILVDEGIASPILLGNPEEVQRAGDRLGLDLAGVSILEPTRSAAFEDYADEYYRLRARRGVTRDIAFTRLRRPHYYGSMMLARGDVDLMLTGIRSHLGRSLRTVIEVIGPAPGIRRISSHTMVLRSREVYFLADCALNIEPDANELAEIALSTASAVRALGIEPRVAMLTFSNFGSNNHPSARKVREATRIAKQRADHLIIDGELQLRTALDGDYRNRYYPFSDLRQDANVLVFPDLQSGSLALQLFQRLGDGTAVGPILTGTRCPVQLLEFGNAVEDVVNLAAVGAVEAGHHSG